LLTGRRGRTNICVTIIEGARGWVLKDVETIAISCNTEIDCLTLEVKLRYRNIGGRFGPKARWETGSRLKWVGEIIIFRLGSKE